VLKKYEYVSKYEYESNMASMQTLFHLCKSDWQTILATRTISDKAIAHSYVMKFCMKLLLELQVSKWNRPLSLLLIIFRSVLLGRIDYVVKLL
jgi:hypothetical protein